MAVDDTLAPEPPRAVSRRSFLRNLGVTAAAVGVSGCRRTEPAGATPAPAPEAAASPPPAPTQPAAAPAGQHEVAVTLRVNGKTHALRLEPRVTLLDALRERLGITGPKLVCGEGTCGACTVLHGGVPIYACLKLAVDAQDAEVRTVEALAPDADEGRLHPVQAAFVEKDAMQCGYCTSGFVTTVAHLVETNPSPTEKDVRSACAGNICRCGTYPRVIEAALHAAGVKPTPRTGG